MTYVAPWVQELVESQRAEDDITSPARGQRVRLVSVAPGNHAPSQERYSGRGWNNVDEVVEVVRGQYWGSYGLSNFWYWRVVVDGEAVGETLCGYPHFKKLGDK